ncbi:MAG: DUF5312 domain-containing protein [Treponema sp.]|nr:DUF5312 domain-containing protein [Treponema sp.]
MNANPVLDRLVSQMDVDERLDLLEKIRESSTISFEPLYVLKEEDGKRTNFEEQYRRLPWFVRLFYCLIGFFSAKPPVKVYEDGRMLAMGKSIEASAPGVYDYRENRLLDGFFRLLIDLKDSARFFYNVLDTSINKDRGAFYAILGSLEMEEIHRKLQADSDPHTALENAPDTLPANLRQAVARSIEDTLQSITDQKREVMYYHARSLNYLRELSCFLFDRLILAFESSPAGQTCRISPTVRELLFNLDKILYSLKDPPALSLFESLFVYELETRADETGFDMDKEMEALLSRAGKSLATIRGFNTRIPLTRIIRCSMRNTGYSPGQVSGGEDWFLVYRNYWRQQADNALTEYFADKKRMDIVATLEAFFGATPEPLANAASETNKDGFPLPEAFALSFLKAFHSVLLGKISGVLRPIIMDGEFTRREDRIGLTEAYNDLMYTAGNVQTLDAKMAPDGEYGKRYVLVKQETEALVFKRRKIQFVQSDVSKEAWDIISRSRDGMGKIVSLLEDIQDRSSGGENSRVANFDKLAGKTPAAFVRSVSLVAENLRQALQVLKDIGVPV